MALGPSDQDRRKAWTAAERLLEPGTNIRAVTFGRANFRMSNTAIGVVVFIGVSFLLALFVGVLLLPGVLVLLALWETSCPQRVVVVADQGVAVLQRNSLRGKITKVVALLPHVALSTASGRKVRLGADVISGTRSCA